MGYLSFLVVGECPLAVTPVSSWNVISPFSWGGAHALGQGDAEALASAETLLGVLRRTVSLLPDLRTLLESQHDRTHALEKATKRIIPWVFHRSGDRIRSYRSQWERAREAASFEERDGVKVLANGRVYLGRWP